MISNSCDSNSAQQIFCKLEQIAIEVGLYKAGFHRDLRIEEDLDADSLTIVEMIMACEAAFDIVFTDEDAMQVETISDLVNLIEAKIEAKHI